MLTRIKQLALINYLLVVFATACTSKHIDEEIKTIAEDDWEMINDTADIQRSIIYTHTENQPTNLSSNYDWSEGFNKLNSKNYQRQQRALKPNSIHGMDTVYTIEQPCIHEKDTVAFSKLIDSLTIANNLSDKGRNVIKATLSKAYRETNFFNNQSAICERFFKIINDSSEWYIKVVCELGYLQLDSLSSGKVTMGNDGGSVTYTSKIYIGDLILVGRLEGYVISNKPIPAMQRDLINHKKYNEKYAYYFTNQSKEVSSKSDFDGTVRAHKVLVSFL